MIIPIRAPENIDGQPTEKVEWVMLELNGELLKPLDEERKKVSIALDANDIRRRVELGAVKFDGDVSIIQLFMTSILPRVFCIHISKLFILTITIYNAHVHNNIKQTTHITLGCTNINNRKS